MSHQSDLIATDIVAYLAQHERKDLLRLLTCGSVDDGKSTLIGRLLHDSKMIYEDQLAAVHRDSKTQGTVGGELDLALLVDGLQAEREQGITIDVAYRYFSTAKRKFIIADTPGHEQYTRNMATGASTCDLAIILVDARRGILTQTRRHSYICSLLGMRHVVVAINKMDLVDYSAEVFGRLRADYLAFAKKLHIQDIHFLPISALNGDNVVHPSLHMPWYDGLPLMGWLETVAVGNDRNFQDFRLPVQYVNRPDLDFRGYCGTIASGIVRPGDEIIVLPSRVKSRVKRIVTMDGDLDVAFPPQAVTLTLTDEIDISRGDLLAHPGNLPHVGDRFRATVVWMNDTPLRLSQPYYLKQTSRLTTGTVSAILHRVDVNTMAESPAQQLQLNEIGLCEISVTTPLAFDVYDANKTTGAFIVIDRLTNATMGAGMITEALIGDGAFQPVTAAERSRRYAQHPNVLWITGAYRSELLYQLERKLYDAGHCAVVLDSEHLGLQRTEQTAQLLVQSGLICLCAAAEAPSTGDVPLIVDSDATDVTATLIWLRNKGILL